MKPSKDKRYKVRIQRQSATKGARSLHLVPTIQCHNHNIAYSDRLSQTITDQNDNPEAQGSPSWSPSTWPTGDLSDPADISWTLDDPPPISHPSPPIELPPPPPPNRSIYPLQTQSGYGINITPYSPLWPTHFLTIQTQLHKIFTTSSPPAPYTTIEHIGSTSIPGLAAKPNIDILVTFPTHSALVSGIEALEWEIPTQPPFTRYTRIPHGGGITGRESFKLYLSDRSEHYYTTPERSVYLIDESETNPAGRTHVRCYRAVRDTLRDPANRDLLDEYAQVKVELGQRIYEDSITYSRLKDGVIAKVLRRAGWTQEEIDEKEKLSQRRWITDDPAY